MQQQKKKMPTYIQGRLFLLAQQFAITQLYHATVRFPLEIFQMQESFVESL